MHGGSRMTRARGRAPEEKAEPSGPAFSRPP
jgi:hypothetical protein